MPRSNWAGSTFLLLASLSFTALGQNAALVAAEHSYPDSTGGLQSQFAAIVRAARSNDEAAFRAALDSLRIPDQEKWFAAHFHPRFQPQLPREYRKALARYQEHISWVMVNFAKFDDFALKVEPSEMPVPVGVSATDFVAPVAAIKTENYRFTSASSDPLHGPPTWVSSFVYIDGRFRYAGGTYPFWEEGLDGARGPSSLPSVEMHRRVVQGIVGRKDEIEVGPGIDAIVQFNIEMDSQGKTHPKVLDGDSAFVKDAKDYLKAQHYGIPPGSDSPKTANVFRTWRAGEGVKTIWDMEVVFSTPKK